jgi:hypothetical protein
MHGRRHTVIAILMFAVLAAFSVHAQEHGNRHTVALPDSLKWVEPAPLPGTSMAVVQGDPGKEGFFVYRLRMPAGYRIPPHLHKASENVTVLSGVFFIGLGEKFDQGKGQHRRTIRTTRGRAAQKRWCRFTAWGRPISGS